MTDTFSKAKRSEIMGSIKSKNTSPELFVRKTMHNAGLRFRLHVNNLPGTPDLVFKKHKTVIFVNGCFFHGHSNCKKGRIPKSNVQFWLEKIERNRARDRKNIARLRLLNWQVLTIWECQLSDPKKIERLISNVRKK